MREQEIFIPILIGTGVFVLVALFINTLIALYRTRRRQHERELVLLKQSFEQELLQAQIEVQEATFRHIASELHDNVCQLLSTAKVLMGIAKMKLPEAPPSLATATETLSKAIVEVRSLSRSLDPEWVKGFSLAENLSTEMARIRSSGTVQASQQIDAVVNLKPEEQVMLFRMVQEAVQNAVRHAAPTAIHVQVAQQDKELEVRIRNNGKPLPPVFEGMGTNNMRQRARLFGGTVQWLRLPGETEVLVRLPVGKA